jgi:hypothetical protein
MRDIRIAAAQFEACDADKDCNFARMADLTHRATAQGAEIVSFHLESRKSTVYQDCIPAVCRGCDVPWGLHVEQPLHMTSDWAGSFTLAPR